VFLVRLLGMEEPPGPVFSGTLLADTTWAAWGLVFVAATTLAWIHGLGYYREDKPYQGEHDVLLLTTPIGMMLMAGATDLLVFFIGLELLSMPLYALAAFRRRRVVSVEAGVKYFLLGSFASGIFLFGAALLFAATGKLGLAEIAEAAQSSGSVLTIAGAALVAAGIFFKVSVFPFHMWAPDVYQGAPTPVTALMATGTKAAAFAFLINATGLLPGSAAGIVALLALVTIAAGNLGALVQPDLKRLLAYSGIAHAGTVLLVTAGTLAAGAELSIEASTVALYYMGAYVFTAAGAFGLLAVLESDGDHFTRIECLRGLARTRPGTAAAMTLFLLSLGGIPATGGFLGKWFVFSVLVEAEMYLVAVIAAVLSVIAFAYYLNVIVSMYMRPAPEGQEPPVTTRPLTAGIATLACCAGVLAMGIAPAWFLDLLK
jgi:NADH-quinone oxidoreductase subunit N